MHKTCNMHLWNMKGKASPPVQTGRKVAESQSSHTDSLNRTPQVSVLGSNTRSPIEDHRNPWRSWRSWIYGHVISCHILSYFVMFCSPLSSLLSSLSLTSLWHFALSVVTRLGNVTNEKLCEDFRTLYQGVMLFSASWRNRIQIKRKMNIYIYIYENS